MLSVSACLTSSRRLRAQRHAQRRLAPPLHAADQHQVGHIRADDQQYKSGHHHQDLEPVLVLFAHAGDTAAARPQVQRLLREDSARSLPSSRPSASAAIASARPASLPPSVAGATPAGCGRSNPASGCPVGSEVALEVAVRRSAEERSRVECAQGVAEETRRSDSHDGKRLFVEVEDAADDGRIGPISLLPQPVAHHRDRRSARLIVLRGQACGRRTRACRTSRSSCQRQTRPGKAEPPLTGLCAGRRTAYCEALKAASSAKPACRLGSAGTDS